METIKNKNKSTYKTKVRIKCEEYKKANGVTFSEIAKKIGVTKQCLDIYFKTPCQRGVTLERIARAINCNLEDLYEYNI